LNIQYFLNANTGSSYAWDLPGRKEQAYWGLFKCFGFRTDFTLKMEAA
jgi:hypothetical protein